MKGKSGGLLEGGVALESQLEKHDVPSPDEAGNAEGELSVIVLCMNRKC